MHLILAVVACSFTGKCRQRRAKADLLLLPECGRPFTFSVISAPHAALRYSIFKDRAGGEYFNNLRPVNTYYVTSLFRRNIVRKQDDWFVIGSRSTGDALPCWVSRCRWLFNSSNN